jgi:translocation and assembly module TamB
VKGTVEAEASAAGTLDSLGITAQIRARDMGMGVPRLGIRIHDGELTAKSRAGGYVEVNGQLASGNGRITLEGQTSATGDFRLALRGEDFQAANLPAAQVLVAPDLMVSGTAGNFRIEGKLTVPEAEINLAKLPRGTRVQRASSDVVVVDDPATQTRTSTALSATIDVTIGDDVHLAGYGLDAMVAGQLRITEKPGAPTSASGQLQVDGRYKAYGQDLTVEKGKVFYGAAPLDDPGLDMTATRRVDEVTAGLRIQGTARRPQVTVFSDPTLGEAQALSYLVAGKPLDQIGAGSEEGDALQSAARSVGTAAGGLLAKNLGKRIGVDQFGIQESEALGGSQVLSVGEYLSPRVFLSYGVGLFEPGEVVQLGYEVSDEVALKAVRGPRDTRVGVEYRLER